MTAKFKDIAAEIAAAPIPDNPQSIEQDIELVRKYWPLVRKVLQVSKLVTRQKVDIVTDRFIAWTDSFLAGIEQDVEKIRAGWPKVRSMLQDAKLFTGTKGDTLIEGFCRYVDGKLV